MNRMKLAVAVLAMTVGAFAACKKSSGSSSGGGTSSSYDGSWTLSVPSGGTCSGLNQTVTVISNGTNMTGSGITGGSMNSGIWQVNASTWSGPSGCYNNNASGTCSNFTTCIGTWTYTNGNPSAYPVTLTKQ